MATLAGHRRVSTVFHEPASLRSEHNCAYSDADAGSDQKVHASQTPCKVSVVEVPRILRPLLAEGGQHHIVTDNDRVALNGERPRACATRTGLVLTIEASAPRVRWP